MDVADDIVILPQTADDIAVHHADMVDVEQQFHVRQIDLADNVRAVIEVVALIAGMAFHGMRMVARVELFQANGNPSGRGIVPKFREEAFTRIGGASFG